nr:helix-turn-helix domain-containing protein [Streptomyces fulvoviolaceus]
MRSPLSPAVRFHSWANVSRQWWACTCTETGKPIPEVAEELGVNPGTLHSWVSRCRRNGSAAADRFAGRLADVCGRPSAPSWRGCGGRAGRVHR